MAFAFDFLDHDESNRGFYQGRPHDVDYSNPTGKDGKPLNPEVIPALWLLSPKEDSFRKTYDGLYKLAFADKIQLENLKREFLATFTGESIYLAKKPDDLKSQDLKKYEYIQYVLANYDLQDLFAFLDGIRESASDLISNEEDFKLYFKERLFVKVKEDLWKKYIADKFIVLNNRNKFNQNLILNPVNDADLLIRLDVKSDALSSLDSRIDGIVRESKNAMPDLLNNIQRYCKSFFTNPSPLNVQYPDRNLSTFIKINTGGYQHRALLCAYILEKCNLEGWDIFYVQNTKPGSGSRPVILIANMDQECCYFIDPSSDRPPKQLTLQVHWEESAESASIESDCGFTENELLKLCFKSKINQKIVDESKQMFKALKDVKEQVDKKMVPETIWQSSYFKIFASHVPEGVTAIRDLSTLIATKPSSKNYAVYEQKSDSIVKKATDAINNHTSRFFKLAPAIREWYKKDIIAKLVHTDQTNIDTIKAMIETHQFKFSKWLPKKRCGQFLKDSKGIIINQVPQRIFDIYNVIISTKPIQDKALEIAILAAEANQHGNAGQQESTIQFYQKILDSLIKQTTHLQRLLG